MKFKKLILLGLFLGLSFALQAQDLVSANFKIADYKKGIQEVELVFDKFVIGIDPQGQVCFLEPVYDRNARDWSDYEDGRMEYGDRRQDNLQVTYYDRYDGRVGRDKIKSINGIPLTYYDQYDIHDKKGYLKSIGKIAFKYNNTFDTFDAPGTLKSVGSINIKYYNTFDIHDTKQTLKSAGPVKVTYYNSFDADRLRGKIKSIKGNTRQIHVTRISQRSDN